MQPQFKKFNQNRYHYKLINFTLFINLTPKLNKSNYLKAVKNINRVK